jgi:hypothetical protein
MQTRLRLLLLLTALIYTLWLTFMMTIGGGRSVYSFAGNVMMGTVLGVQAVFLSDNSAPRLYLRDGAVTVCFFAALALLFAAFTLRSNFTYGYIDFFGNVVVDGPSVFNYLWHFLWRGGILGLLLWGLAVINVLLHRTDTLSYALAAVLTLVTLFSAPFVANALFNGAVFVVVAVGCRLMVGFLVHFLSIWWQGFIFGASAGFVVVMIPFLGYYGYGAI